MGIIICQKHNRQGVIINIHEDLIFKIENNIKIDDDELEIIFEEFIH